MEEASLIIRIRLRLRVRVPVWMGRIRGGIVGATGSCDRSADMAPIRFNDLAIDELNKMRLLRALYLNRYAVP